MTACQSVTGNWLAIRVEARSARSSITFGQVAPLAVAQRREHPVVEGEQVELRQTGEQSGVRAVPAADGQLVQQARHTKVARGEAAAACPFDECTSEKALPDPARPGDDQIVALGEPGAGAQREDLLAVEAFVPGGAQIAVGVHVPAGPAGQGERPWGRRDDGVELLGGHRRRLAAAAVAGRALVLGEYSARRLADG